MSKYGHDEQAVFNEWGITSEEYDEIIEQQGTLEEAAPVEEGESL